MPSFTVTACVVPCFNFHPRAFTSYLHSVRHRPFVDALFVKPRIGPESHSFFITRLLSPRSAGLRRKTGLLWRIAESASSSGCRRFRHRSVTWRWTARPRTWPPCSPCLTQWIGRVGTRWPLRRRPAPPCPIGCWRSLSAVKDKLDATNAWKINWMQTTRGR